MESTPKLGNRECSKGAILSERLQQYFWVIFSASQSEQNFVSGLHDKIYVLNSVVRKSIYTWYFHLGC